MKNGSPGFTLLEVLIAMVIMTVIGTVLASTVLTISRSWQSVEAGSDRLRRLQDIVLISWYDFSQAAPYQASQSALSAPLLLNNDAHTISLQRHGLGNPFGLPRDTLEVVQYNYGDHRLERSLGASAAAPADANDTEKPPSHLLADDTDVQADVIDSSNNAHASWGGDTSTTSPPRLLSLQLTMKPFGEVEADIPLLFWQPDTQVANAPPSPATR